MPTGDCQLQDLLSFDYRGVVVVLFEEERGWGSSFRVGAYRRTRLRPTSRGKVKKRVAVEAAKATIRKLQKQRYGVEEES